MKSDSSTTSDNTTEFIDIVKKYDVVYNNHNPDYKNVDVKMKVWSQIADEIGLSIDASKRKWKNLRDSYTKYLRSFRVGTKTSKKYQFWAHAEHMDFLKPYQGPGRNSSNTSGKGNDDDDIECDLGLQVLTKISCTTNDEDTKSSNNPSNSPSTMSNGATTTNISAPVTATTSHCSMAASPNGTYTNASFSTSGSAGTLVLPVPSLPTVQLPPQLSSKSNILGGPITSLPTSMPSTQVFPIPQISASTPKGSITMPANSTTSSVGCLIIEPQLFANSDSLKKEFATSTNTTCSSMGPPLYNIATPTTVTTPTSRGNPPLITKIRRVQPTSLQTTNHMTTALQQPITTPTYQIQQPPNKIRKVTEKCDIDISTVLQANRELDSNTLFFLSLARAVRGMPLKFQSLAKMRCMRIISDIEMELDNVDCGNSLTQPEDCTNSKFPTIDTPPPPDGTQSQANVTTNDIGTEHFVYCMSPSKVESMIDISSDEDGTGNGV